MSVRVDIVDRVEARVLFTWQDDRPLPRVGEKLWLGTGCWLVDAVVWDYPDTGSIAWRDGKRASAQILVVTTKGEPWA